MDQNKILVVGAFSKVGSALVEQLTARGQTVKAATRTPGTHRAAPGVELTAFDYDVADSDKPALEGADRVFMLTKWTELHPEVTLNRFIEHARSAGVRHLVFMSSLGVDKEPPPSLPLVEKRIAGTGMGYTFLRPNWLMQNFSHGFLLPTIRDISLIVAPTGWGQTSFVDARDVAAVAADALVDGAHNGQTLYLTGPEALTYEQAAGILSDATNRSVRFQDANEEEMRRIMADRFEPDQQDYLVKLFGFVRDGQDGGVSSDLATALGREPTSFAQFARDYAGVWR
jgi:uncharacterized protein YbjT (DUF2867 family)